MAGEASIQSLFSWLDAAGNENVLDVDVVMSASDKRTAKLTDHVVETGAVITDHVVIQPESLSLDLVVTQTPMFEEAGFGIGRINISPESSALESANHNIKVRPSEFKPGGFLLLSSGLRTAVSAGLSAITGGAIGGNSLPSKFQGSATKRTATSGQVSVLKAETPIDRVNRVHDRLVEIMNSALLVTVSFKGKLYVEYLLTSVEITHAAGKAGSASFKVEARAFRTVTGTTASLPDPSDFKALPKSNKGNNASKTPDPDPTKKAVSRLKKGAIGFNEGDTAKAFSGLFGFGG